MPTMVTTRECRSPACTAASSRRRPISRRTGTRRRVRRSASGSGSTAARAGSTAARAHRRSAYGPKAGSRQHAPRAGELAGLDQVEQVPEVDVVDAGPEVVTAGIGEDGRGAEGAADATHQPVDDGRGRRGRVVVPQGVDDVIGGRRRPTSSDEVAEELSRLAPAEPRSAAGSSIATSPSTRIGGVPMPSMMAQVVGPRRTLLGLGRAPRTRQLYPPPVARSHHAAAKRGLSEGCSARPVQPAAGEPGQGSYSGGASGRSS